MIEESLLDEWAAHPEKMTREQISMICSQLKVSQRNDTNIYVFTQAYFDVSDNKIGTPSDTEITPEKLKGFVLEKVSNGSWYVATGKPKIMDQQPQPPVITPIPQPTTPANPVGRLVSNQDILNAFFLTYGEGEYWGKFVESVGTQLSNEMITNRIMTYTAFDKLPKEVIDYLKLIP